MIAHQYSYSILRYIHDPAIEEFLNVGVLLYCHSARQMLFRSDKRIGRLKSAFPDVDGQRFKQSMEMISRAIGDRCDSLKDEFFGSSNNPPSLESVISLVLPDAGLSFRFNKARSGFTNDLEAELDFLFKRHLPDRVERDAEVRSDAQVWSAVVSKLKSRGMADVLVPRSFQSESIAIDFDHAYKNERWHAFQPVSLDLVSEEGIMSKAEKWVGCRVGLSTVSDFGSLILFVGASSRPENRDVYRRALSLLKRMPYDSTVIEEEQADDELERLEFAMREHGVIE